MRCPICQYICTRQKSTLRTAFVRAASIILRISSRNVWIFCCMLVAIFYVYFFAYLPVPLFPLQVRRYGIGTPFAVYTCRYDSAGISRSFSAGEQSLYGDVLQGFVVAYDADRGRSTCFYGNHHCLVGQEAVRALAEQLEAPAQSAADEFRHPEVKRRRNQSRAVRGIGQVVADFPVDEVRHTLRRSRLPHVTLLPAELLQFLLKVHYSQCMYSEFFQSRVFQTSPFIVIVLHLFFLPC